VEDKEAEARGASYRLAFEDVEFLQSDAMRPLRLALEFSKVDLVLKEKASPQLSLFGAATTSSRPKRPKRRWVERATQWL
jgi:hypothetical protein